MIETDVVIAGAGPSGLFQVFELGLLGVHAHVVDSVPNVGGQCTELYPDKPIYDIPAIPVCSAQELIQRLQTQIRPFHPEFHLGDTVKQATPLSDGRFLVTTRNGTAFQARALIIAGGLGAFVWRKLAVPEADALEGKSVHYRVTDSHPFDGKDLVIAGGGDAAIDWTLALLDRARSLVLIHHSTKFRAAPAHVQQMQQLCADGRMQFVEGEIIGLETEQGALRSVRTRMRSGVVQRIGADDLLVFWGMHPALGPIAEWGLALDQQQVVVDPATFRTSVPGIYAVGDIASYPGEEEADPVGLPRGRAVRVRGQGIPQPRAEGAPAVHDHQPDSAPAPRRRRGCQRRPDRTRRRCGAGDAGAPCGARDAACRENRTLPLIRHHERKPMNEHDEIDAGRRSLLKNGLAVAAIGAVAATGLIAPRRVFAQAAKMSQATAMYQDKPHGQDMCSNCIHFIPGKTKDAPGTCKVVEGNVSPQGWCIAYARKAGAA